MRVVCNSIQLSSMKFLFPLLLWFVGNNFVCLGQEAESQFLVPIVTKVKKNKVEFRAAGEKLILNGDLYTIKAKGEISGAWTLDEDLFTTFHLTLKANESTEIEKVTWFSGDWNDGFERTIYKTNLSDHVIFLRKNGVSFFISLDFPYSKIDSSGIHYPPSKHLRKGEEYIAHSISIGACKLSGIMVGQYDRNEIEAVSDYITCRYPNRFEKPITIMGSITNRMTDVKEGRIFYSMYDNPTVSMRPDLIKEDLNLSAELGIEYYQMFEGAFDLPDNVNTDSILYDIKNCSNKLGVKIGDYMVPQGLYCPHYNYSHQSVGRKEWLIRGQDGALGAECLASDDYIAFWKDRLLQHNTKFGMELICLDFLYMNPCYATNHNHPPGDVYRQVLSLVTLMEDLAKLNPNFLVWTNAGNWLDLMPKLVWYNPNVYLTDPHAREYSPHLNPLKVLGDWRREQMVSVHESHFVPYRYFTNCEYYFAPYNRVSDINFYKYSLLQGLAVTPNLTLGEMRTFLNRIPGREVSKVKEFIKYWVDFVKENWNVWKNTLRIGDSPGIDAAEVYAHMGKNGGFLSLVNQNSYTVSAKVVLNSVLGLSERSNFLLAEHYPERKIVKEMPLPYAMFNDSINFDIPPNTVRIIEVIATENQITPFFTGIEVDSLVEISAGKYRVFFEAPQGEEVEVGVVLPPLMELVGHSVKHLSVVPMYTFEAASTLKQKQGNLTKISVRAPRKKAPGELNEWQVDTGKEMVNLSKQSEGFLGALVHNAFTEDYSLQLDIVSAQASKPDNSTRRVMQEHIKEAGQVALPFAQKRLYETSFVLPFIESHGMDRAVGEDPIVELLFRNPNKVSGITLWLNNKKVPVQTYENPRAPGFQTRYFELKGQVSGNVSVRLEVEYLN